MSLADRPGLRLSADLLEPRWRQNPEFTGDGQGRRNRQKSPPAETQRDLKQVERVTVRNGWCGLHQLSED